MTLINRDCRGDREKESHMVGGREEGNGVDLESIRANKSFVLEYLDLPKFLYMSITKGYFIHSYFLR